MPLFNFFRKRETKASLIFSTEPVNISRTEALNLALNNPYVVSAIKMIANSVSRLDYMILNAEGEIVPNHELNWLLRYPAPTTTFWNFLNKIVWQLYLYGNAYIQKVYVNNQLKLLNLIPSQVVTPSYDNNGQLVYNVLVNTKLQRLQPSEIIHVKFFNFDDTVLSSSPLDVIIESVYLNNSARRWNRSLLENGARPSGALVTERVLTHEEYLRLKEEIQTKFSGYRNAGRPLLLEGGVKWEPMSLSPAEMDFYNVMKLSAREIALGLGVPSELLGDNENKTYSNYQEAQKQFYLQTVLPVAEMIVEQISAGIFKKGEVIAIDYRTVDAINEAQDAVMGRLLNAFNAGVMSVNEVRKALNLPAVLGGDDLYIPVNKVPIGSVNLSDGIEE